MEIRFIDVGFGNLVSAGRIMNIDHVNSAPTKRDIATLRKKGLLRDSTKGRKARALIYLDDGSAILSTLLPATLNKHLLNKTD